MTLSDVALARPKATLLLLASFFVLGILSYRLMPQALIPDVEEPELRIWIGYPNASPAEEEEQIARPVEEILKTVRGVSRLRSWSTPDGVFVFVQFEWGTDMGNTYVTVRDRLDRVWRDLPDDVERYRIWKERSNEWPILWTAIFWKGERADLYELVEKTIRPRIQRIDGIANVEVWGAEERQVFVDLDRERMKAHGVSVGALRDALSGLDLALTAGIVEEGGTEYVLRTVAGLSDPREVAAYPIGGGRVLGDVATVRYDYPERRGIDRVNGREAVTIGVMKEFDANTVDVCAAARRVLDEAIGDTGRSDLEYVTFFDQSKWITDALHGLLKAGLLGGVLALLVLYVFLRRARVTVLVSLGIPLSIFVTLTVLYLAGFTMNLITMMGLMVAIGMLVDNSVVVLENILRLRQLGASPADAARTGTRQVALAITAATLTTAIVFLPLVFMEPGEAQIFFAHLGITITVALLASLVVALTFLPIATESLPDASTPGRLRWLDRLAARYRRVLAWTLAHRMPTFTITLLLFASLGGAGKLLEQTDEAANDTREIWVRVGTASTFSLEELDGIYAVIEDTLWAHAEELELQTVYTRVTPHSGRVALYLDPVPRTGRKTSDIVEDLDDVLPTLAGVEYRTRWERSSSKEGGVGVLLQGDDHGVLETLAEEVERRLARVPGITAAYVDREEGSDEVHVTIGRELARRYGADPRTAAGVVASSFRGVRLPRLRGTDREIDVELRLEEADRKSLAELQDFPVPTVNGGEVPLGAIARFDLSPGMGTIERRDRKSSVLVKADTNEEDLKKLKGRVAAMMADFRMPRGYEWTLGERFERLEESQGELGKTLLLAVVLVFLLMGALFESFFHPAAVLVSIPFAMVGVMWGLVLTGTPMDLMATIGTVLIVGVVVNNAIVLVDHVNHLRREGAARDEAILRAGEDRLRPILMTATTTIIGLIPMSVGRMGVGDAMYYPLARAVMGGLAVSTVGTLVVLPVFYCFFDDLWPAVRAIFARSARPWRRGEVLVSGSPDPRRLP